MDNINVDNLAADWLDIKGRREGADSAKRHAIEEDRSGPRSQRRGVIPQIDGHKITLTQPCQP